MNDVVESEALDAAAIAALAEQLNQLLHLRTFPIGMKLFEDWTRWPACPACAARPRARRSRPASL
jgi:hypothetical protein